MPRTYYRVVHDPRIDDAWFPGFPVTEDGTLVDGRLFTKGLRYTDPGRLSLPLEKEGRQLDFTLAAFDLPVLASRCAAVVDDHVPPGSIQRVPVTVAGAQQEYEIVNVTKLVECLDEQRSTVSHVPSDLRSPTSGKYRWVIDLTLDPSQIGSECIFRVQNWPIALIVCEPLRDVLADATGITFVPVT
jgi:hypothetical protein